MRTSPSTEPVLVARVTEPRRLREESGSYIPRHDGLRCALCLRPERRCLHPRPYGPGTPAQSRRRHPVAATSRHRLPIRLEGYPFQCHARCREMAWKRPFWGQQPRWSRARIASRDSLHGHRMLGARTRSRHRMPWLAVRYGRAMAVACIPPPGSRVLCSPKAAAGAGRQSSGERLGPAGIAQLSYPVDPGHHHVPVG